MPIIPRGTPFGPLPPTSAPLHHLRRRIAAQARRRGMGDITLTTGGTSGDFGGEAGPAVDPSTGVLTTPVSTTPSWETAIASSLPTIIGNGFKTLQLAIAPTGSYITQGANGAYTVANQAGVPGSLNLGTSSISSFMPVILIGGGALVAFVAVMGAFKK